VDLKRLGRVLDHRHVAVGIIQDLLGLACLGGRVNFAGSRCFLP
jgi:hypothetical protein